MRRILVDYARDRDRDKRGGGVVLTSLGDKAIAAASSLDVVALDEALDRLARHGSAAGTHRRTALLWRATIEETADALDISPATVKRDWTWAKAWLYQQLSPR